MKIEENIPLVENILSEWKDRMGGDHEGYKNHVYRMVNFCFALREFTPEQREKIVIAGCFHDLGIWPDNTFDYLPPSIALAKDFLQTHGLEKWSVEIETMIDQHHKLRNYDHGEPTIEVFRRGDLVDFSLGIVKCGLPRDYVKKVKQQFPNAGFHKHLVGVAGRWICRHPLNPIPVLKW
jgi:hypothetical protein